VTNAVNDELISTLDYKMRTSNASYVTSRKDVQFFPSSLSTFTSTTSRVARIPLTTGGDFLDPESIKIAFRLVNNDATNDFHPLTGHPGCLVKRIQLFANGQRTDDIDHYGRNVHMYTLLKPREYTGSTANEGFEINDVSNFPAALPPSHFQEVLVAPTLVGLLGCGKMLPPQLNLVLEIEFADPAEAVRGGQTSSVDFELQNVRVLASQVTLDSALVESFNRVLLSGCSLVFSYPTVHTQTTSVPAGFTEFNVTVSRAYTPSFWERSSHFEPTPIIPANGTSFLESQMQLGPMQVPHYPAQDFAEHHHFLHILAQTYDSTIRNMRLTKNMYENESFESSITGNVLNDGQTTEISGITAGQLATVLTAYTPLTDTAGNTAAIAANATISANNSASIANLQSQIDALPAPPDLAPYALASDLAAAEGLIAANQSSLTALNTSLTTGLATKANQSALDALQLE
ncbi:unnamed protein product, partial [Symbiodinium necroappetens]